MCTTSLVLVRDVDTSKSPPMSRERLTYCSSWTSRPSSRRPTTTGPLWLTRNSSRRPYSVSGRTWGCRILDSCTFDFGPWYYLIPLLTPGRSSMVVVQGRPLGPPLAPRRVYPLEVEHVVETRIFLGVRTLLWASRRTSFSRTLLYR